MIRVLACAMTLSLVACEGTQTGRSLFGTPSNNHVSTIQLSLPTPANRNSGTQYLTLQVNAIDSYGNVITVPYNGTVTLSSNGSSCEVGFNFYQNLSTGSATPPPTDVSLTFNSPQAIAIVFNPNCGGPNPVTITASAPGATNGTLTF